MQEPVQWLRTLQSSHLISLFLFLILVPSPLVPHLLDILVQNPSKQCRSDWYGYRPIYKEQMFPGRKGASHGEYRGNKSARHDDRGDLGKLPSTSRVTIGDRCLFVCFTCLILGLFCLSVCREAYL